MVITALADENSVVDTHDHITIKGKDYAGKNSLIQKPTSWHLEPKEHRCQKVKKAEKFKSS